MAIMRASILRNTLAVSRPLRPSVFSRTYASKENMQAEGGQVGTGSSNVGNPLSSSPEAKSINDSRATDSAQGSPDTKSIQTPVTDPKGAAVGQQEDDTSTQQAFKQDPNAPASEKRKNVEEKGQRPLDPADK